MCVCGCAVCGCVVCVVWVAHISIVKTKKLRFFRIRKEKGRNGEDNKDNKINRKWKRKKEMEKGKGKNDDQKWSVFQVLYKRRAKSTEEPTEFYTKQETALCVCFLFFLINLVTG